MASGQCPLLLNSYILSGWVSGNHKYDLSSDETWMLKKPRKSFMQPMTVCLPWLNSYRCHTQLYARLWKYHSSYRKQVDLCVWILFMWYQKLKLSCLVIFRDEGTFGPTPEMLSRRSRTSTWPGMSWEFTLLGSVFWDYVTEHIYIWPFGILLMERHTELNMFWDLISSGIALIL
jgi:hypothetical protein